MRAEWAAKPVAFVSYGGTADGLRAVEQLRPVFAELHAVPVRVTVSLTSIHRRLTLRGALTDPAAADHAAELMLDRLTWWAPHPASGPHPRPPPRALSGSTPEDVTENQ